ncbi:bifunctional hydroxymethylpyrimidine kinase/phosphomethylpyrimidine kinase [Peribacillus loiseleuriae]|uniref:Hydroxymethylpyrimidine/phosphomethylpyrimidine kinase n=1 Tax=Peribacillus loiseleuriae TaxID=1679170 RepID=A0A0K9GXZ3_9BACI|nr:bifunctional hydroxymethylpyrimidine kinase/phosphomethylpyrimidine kinase [Peribacillus loiseleuriae]KMY51485.1 phosphomethylpyrimidine kinase [Peribacillus loiseleuriae]
MKTALTIAGSDSGGGAGIQADLKTFSAHHVFGMSVITAVTAQNTVEVRSIQTMSKEIIRDQISAVFDDIEVHAVKIGMLGSAENIEMVAKTLHTYKPQHIILDPVMISKSGDHLLEIDAVEALKKHLIPMATIVTPNLPEAETLSGITIQSKQDLYEACQIIEQLGAKAILLKGGHSAGDPNDLYYDGANYTWLRGERILTKNTHGTGCTLSSAIAANMANGLGIEDAIYHAKEYITKAICESFAIGKGHGPVNHFYRFQEVHQL